jgi:hypothetical protein
VLLQHFQMQLLQIPGFGDSSHAVATASSSLAMTSFGIPLTGSMSAGFTIGFYKDDRICKHKGCIYLIN